jgi:hypothetical protein
MREPIQKRAGSWLQEESQVLLEMLISRASSRLCGIEGRVLFCGSEMTVSYIRDSDATVLEDATGDSRGKEIEKRYCHQRRG